AIFGLIALVLLWPRYAVTVKRLHDRGLPFQLALVHLLHFGVAICQTAYVFIELNAERPGNTQYWHLVLAILFYAILAGVLLLCLIPGNKGTNRYGRPPRGPQTQAADVF
ncbi:MAG: DUF805 domain-containing protein, partial [Asticcacaulis sp.]|nr:DUF805 domain-containing protein [Asticcacaulis sp.]